MKKLNVYDMSSGTINHKELVKLFVLARKNDKTPGDLSQIAESLGYDSRTKIQRSDIAEIERKLMEKKKVNYVIIKDMSAGNDSVGEMWQETKIFPSSTTLKEVMKWALGPNSERYSQKRITITIPDTND